MKLLHYATIIAIITLFAACKKNDTQPTPQNHENYSAYLPLAVGNYWVYDHYNTDSTGNTVLSGTSTDSFWVEKDTSVGGNTFYIIKSTASLYRKQILRWQGSQLLDVYSMVYFDAVNFTDILERDTAYQDTIALITSEAQMQMPADSIVVPAGTFKALNLQWTNITTDNFPQPNLVRINDNYYTHNVGKVKFHLSYTGGGNRLTWALRHYSLR